MKGKGPFGGIHFLLSPTILTLDIEFVKRILIKDFSHFEDRGVYYNEKDDPLSAHLFALKDEPWRKLRSKLTPTFTSGKMKFMYPTVIDVGNRFTSTLTNILNTSNGTATVEIKDLLVRFTTDVIGTCAFGIECNSLYDPNSQFHNMGQRHFASQRNSPLVGILTQIFDNAARFLGVKQLHDDVSEFFMKVVLDTMKYREENNVSRNDFMDILLKLKNQEHSGDGNKNTLTVNEIAAQAFVFFIAGFETSSTTMNFSLYELALNPSIQNKLRNEINSVIERHDGKLSYEAMMDMPYLDQVINESLRKYPPLGIVFRRVTKDYHVPEYNFTLKRGTLVWIPAYAIQHDPENYPNPDEYDPERFTTEQVRQRNSVTFLPFGDGPRNCIGMRFGMMQARIGLIMLLRHFKFTLSSKTPVPLKLQKNTFILAPEGGLWLDVSPV